MQKKISERLFWILLCSVQPAAAVTRILAFQKQYVGCLLKTAGATGLPKAKNQTTVTASTLRTGVVADFVVSFTLEFINWTKLNFYLGLFDVPENEIIV